MFAFILAVCGLLLVRSEPAGCNIAVDGISIGGTTPRLITTLDAERVHHITLRKAGYRPSTFEVRFSGRKPVYHFEQLVLDSGTINVVTEPAGAEVTVNGIVRGKSPVLVKEVPNGRATVRLNLEGFEEEVRELATSAGQEQTLSVVLKGLPGTLHLTTLPPGGRFYVNNDFRGQSPAIIPNLKPGKYEVRAEVEGYAPQTRTITIGNGASVREEFRLSNVMGRLEVRTTPPGANVWLDGKPVGITKTNDPFAERSDVLAIENLMAGEHTLTVRCHGYAEFVRRVNIRPAKTAKWWKVKLKRVFTPDVRIVTDTGTYDAILVRNEPEYVVVELKLGLQSSFKRSDIRKIILLSDEAGK